MHCEGGVTLQQHRGVPSIDVQFDFLLEVAWIIRLQSDLKPRALTLEHQHQSACFVTIFQMVVLYYCTALQMPQSGLPATIEVSIL